MLYKFSHGAKEDLLALQNEYSFADIIGFLKTGVSVKGQIKYKHLMIKAKGGMVMTVTFDHLEKPARYYTFQCAVCWDSHKIEVGDTCDFCNGSGLLCNECEEGLSFKTIACPNCTGKQTLGDSDEWINRGKIERAQSHGNGRPIPRQAKQRKRRKTGTRN